MNQATCRISDCVKTISHKRNQLCKMHQSRWERTGTTDARQPATLRDCDVQGCSNKARSGSAAHCKKHYHRNYRHGSVDKVASESNATASFHLEYRTIYAPNHPTSGKTGMTYEHRAVLYDAIGPGAHPCHWCGKSVTWEAGKSDERQLQVDHLSGVQDDNSIENLAPSCRRCNTVRAAQARHEALTDAGFWSAHDTIARTARGRTELIGTI